MKGRMRFGLGIVLSIIWCLILTNLALADTEELRAIQASIKARDALWTAGESWVTRLSPEERQALLGEKTLEFGIFEPVEPPSALLALGYPPAIDWRNKDGHNWVTPIKDQETCGSCVAFGAVATLESLVRIDENQPDLDIDLSEMHLFNCGGGSCIYGWHNSAACSYLKNNGTPDEACWPYEPVNEPCWNTCPDWQSRATKIANYGHISGVEPCKTYVAISPILVAFDVYTDFFYYESGIYEHIWGRLEGGHAVCIVGYDTTGPVPYWIVKNSWGPDWGESGFFRIKMGECNIETRSSSWMSMGGWPTAYSQMLEESSKESDLEILRRYRDEVLSKNRVSRRYVKRLYLHSYEVLRILLANPDLAMRTKELIEPNLSGLCSVVNGGEMVLENPWEVDALMRDFAKEASPSLRLLVKQIRRDLWRGKAPDRFGFTLQMGSTP